MSNLTHQDSGAGNHQPARSDSPIGGDQQRISMKIQFHITVAPENEPLILDASATANSSSQQQDSRTKPRTSSIGEQIQEKLNLSRQNSANESTRRRQQRLLAMHNSTATTTSGGSSFADTPLSQTVDDPMAAAAAAAAASTNMVAQSDDNLVRRRDESRLVAATAGDQSPMARMLPPVGREAGARSSTITGGMADEATVRFLQRTGDHQHQQRPELLAMPQRFNSAANLTTSSPATAASQSLIDRERIYFKRDGQRFGHEFTLKLSVERTYRCLLKVRPLIPLQSISIQGHQLLFVDCSQQQQPTGGGGSAPGSTSSSTVALNQRLRSGSAVVAALPSRHLSQPVNDAYLKQHHLSRNHQHQNHHQNHHNHNHHNHYANHPRSQHPTSSHQRGLYHARTTGSLYRTSIDQQQPQPSARLIQLAESTSLYRQQQNQMMRHFAASYCSSSNSHLGNQLIYMFDWPASRFEVNKNKNRTQIQTVLKFKNGQILSLPLQVKFYQSDCRQHLEWGSQLHFIDYDCQINQLGQISVDRIQYY